MEELKRENGKLKRGSASTLTVWLGLVEFCRSGRIEDVCE
jgi:hypothetical protein